MQLLSGEGTVIGAKSVLVLVLGGALTGCSVAERWAAPRDDYRLYRAARVAKTNAERLAFSQRYLRELPDGRFRAEIESWFRSAEPKFYAAARDRPSLLRAYLRAMPDGPHSSEVRQRLSEFELLRNYSIERERRGAAELRRVQDALDRADRERREFVAMVTELVGLVARIQTFARPITELEEPLLQRFRQSPAPGSCNDERCVKDFAMSFAIPADKRLVTRGVTLRLAFQLQRGDLARVTFGGPRFFDRLAEAVDLEPVVPTNLSGRVEAIARATQLLGNAIEGLLPSLECEGEAIAPVVVLRECRGVRLELRAGVQAGEEDRIEVRASRRAGRAGATRNRP